VIVGINPDVAYTMVRLGLDLNTVHTALDLDEGLAVLNQATTDRSGHHPGAAPRRAPPAR
jgi:rsbT antagonist protein RsbS